MHAALDRTDAITEEQFMARSMVQLQKKVLNDKTVADSVEAILGAYILVSRLYFFFIEIFSVIFFLLFFFF